MKTSRARRGLDVATAIRQIGQQLRFSRTPVRDALVAAGVRSIERGADGGAARPVRDVGAVDPRPGGALRPQRGQVAGGAGGGRGRGSEDFGAGQIGWCEFPWYSIVAQGDEFMTVWNYRVIFYRDLRVPLQEMCDVQGQEGWELVGVTPHLDKPGFAIDFGLIFKKPAGQ
ncbi:hypothetical protein MF672_044335 [Actinomadura sp. ATCC 31491]|uniref:DUF4177 domain-containing protein n=1 Tax=Actinomadura luzonensis TaxID=2805427 RepID=A0ABT0G8S5_9ACTN|nr:hypothetical protein [Actinomadura luzonensis]MCK2220788.1 hypothetical protein [Actinomadura luzonensis]